MSDETRTKLSTLLSHFSNRVGLAETSENHDAILDLVTGVYSIAMDDAKAELHRILSDNKQNAD